MSSSNPIINLKGLKFQYKSGSDLALDGIDLEVYPGEFVAVIGPSRAGKSTMCLTLNGLIPHFLEGTMEGDVSVTGKSTRESSVKVLSKEVALVFQDFESQLFSTSAALDVAFGPENFALEHEEIVRRVQDSLEMVGLSGFEQREPASLSGGEKQRLAIASALALNSPILVLDEPTTDLDPVGKSSVLKVAGMLRDTHKHTIICVEHEMEELIVADRIVLVIEGKIKMQGTPKDVLTNVDLLSENGVMPLGIPNLFTALGIESAALTVEEGAEELNRLGYQLSSTLYQRLISEDLARRKSYGHPIIKVQNLSFGYTPSTPILKNLSFDILEGEFLAILGQNGSGKTTLAKQFNGLLLPTDGKVLVVGEDTKSSGIYKLSKTIGYVFQNPDNQIFADTIGDEVAFGPKNYKFSPEEISIRVKEALDSVGLGGREGEDPFSLTKGERQRVAVASVLAMKPKILILDEPTTGLDYKEQIGIMELLKKLNNEGTTIIIITHSMWAVSHYAHRGIVMNHGQVVLEGSIRDIFANEETLIDLHLKPLQITQLSNRFGKTLLTVDEAKKCFMPGE